MSAQEEAAEFLAQILRDVSNGSVDIVRSEPGSDVFKVSSQGFLVGFVRIAESGALLSLIEEKGP